MVTAGSSGSAQGCFHAVVEDKDATQDQRHIKEVNTGIFGCPR